MDSYVLLDIRGLALRSLHSGTDMEGDRDSLTGKVVNTPGHALYKLVTSVLQPILKDFRVGQVIAVWDGGNAYREKLFPAYKAARKAREQSPEMQHAISETIKNTKLMLKFMGITQVVVDTVEADDTIAWMAKQLPASVIYTVDRDLVQLGDGNILVNVGHEFVDSFKDKDVDVPFNRVVLYKSLVGDTSDGYPGVKGFGPAKWKKLVEAYGDDGLQQLEDMHNGTGYNLLHELAPSEPLLGLIQQDLKGWMLSWTLACLHPELVSKKWTIGGKDCFLTPRWSKAVPSAEKLGSLLDSVGAPELREMLAPFMPNPAFILDASVLEDEAATLADAAQLFAESPFVAIDWETSAPVNDNFKEAAKGREYVDMLSSRITGAGFTFGKNLEHTFYATFDHADSNNLPAEFLTKLIECIPDSVPKVAQNCLLGDVEVLTPNGWKRIDEATTADQIMQWDPKSGSLSFTYPTAKVQQTASRLWKWSSSFHACAYTSDHRMYLRRNDADWKVYSAEQAADLHPNGFYLPIAGDFHPEQEIDLSGAEAQLMEAIRADGSIPKKGRKIRFHFSKSRKIQRLKNLLDTLGMPYSVSVSTGGVGPTTTIRIEDHEVGRRIEALLGPNKSYGPWVLNLSMEAREAVLDEIRHWDGDRHPNSSSNRVSTVSQETVDALQLMAHVSGRRFSVSWTPNQRASAKAQPLAQVCIAPKHKTKLSVSPESLEGVFSVYCFAVPTGAFMVRSNGKVHITGNCYFERSVYKNQFGKELTHLHDTKVMGSHYDEQETNGLKDMSLRYLGYKQLHYGDVIEKGKAMRDYSAEHVFKYGADDPIVTAHLYEFLKLQLLLEGTWDFVRTKEFPPIYMLSDAYMAGVDIDWNELENLRVADAKVFDESMSRLRQLLRENQTPEFLQKGISNLLEVEREIIDAKAKQKVKDKEMSQDEASEWAATEVASLRLKIEERVTYRDLERVEKEIEFSPTPKQFSEVAEYLGLPGIEEKTKKAWEAWHTEAAAHLSSPRAQTLHERVGSSMGNLHLTNGASKTMPGRESLVRFCTEIKRELLPDEKRYKLEGSELSLGSPAQMKALLYGMLCLPLRIRNFDVNEEREDLGLEGSPQANEDAILTAMATDAPEGSWKREALECLLTAKKAHTRNSNFYSKYPLWKHPISGLIHPQLNSCGTETRRMSGSSPNLMQMPKRGEGIKFRSAVIPLKGHDLICSIDWAGEELRVGAGLSRDIEMLSCYIDGEVLKTLPGWMIEQLGPEFVKRFQSSTLRDIHSLTAAGIAQLSYDEFERIRHDDTHRDAKKLKKIRGDAKGVNFLSQYGGGPTKLARKLICDPEIAKDYLSAKKRLYSGYEAWRTASIEKLHEQGYLTTLFGSHRHLFSKLLTSDEGMKGYLERSALNSLIQGVCADYLKVVLTDLHHRQTFQRHGAQFLAPIHDELVFSCHSSQAPSLILEVHEIMTQGIPGLPCPLWAEPSLGPNFGTQIEIGPHPTPELINQAISKALDLREAA